MKKIYVAGPYSADNIMDVLAHIRNGIETGAALIRKGYAVFCPFLDFLYALSWLGPSLTKQDYQYNSLAWVDVCDVVFVLEGWEYSPGTMREIARAQELNIPVVFDDSELNNLLKGETTCS